MRLSVAVMISAAALSIFAFRSYAKDAVVREGSKVAFDYVLSIDGKIIDTSQATGPLEYVQGEDGILPELARRIKGMKAGEEKVIHLKPEEAYGNPDPAGFKEIPISSLPREIKPKVGLMLQTQDQEGRIFPAKITEVKKDSIIVDINHPLAGKALTFKVRVASID